MSLVAFAGFFIGAFFFGNANFLPGLIFFGAFITPFSLLIFFWEMNILKNISLYRTTVYLIKGGIVSLLYTVTLYAIVDGYKSPLLVGFVEETAKVLALLLLVDHRNYRYVLNGLLIGAAVGTGFAAFESAGYILVTAMNYGIPTMLGTIFWRAVFAPGNHIAWAALMGAAFLWVKGNRPFHLSMLLNLKFLGMYAFVILMHALWDLPIAQPVIVMVPLLPVLLTVLSWAMLLAMMRLGFLQVYREAEKETT
ncbi:hypothetical protein SDC9_158250 [bioreactor metagenome]|uniref:Protease PrsW n=1 Tax=bioreactor metagenome TaxID=1076179 RepID=A0A645FBK5_9ZZZZ